MKKYYSYFIFVLLGIATLTSCVDIENDDYDEYLKNLEEYQKQVYEQYQVDSVLISDYVTEFDTLAVYHEKSGIYYTILDEGDELKPDVNSIVAVQYKGTLLDGTVFDETEDDETLSFSLSNLITGWQIGVPLIGGGGKIILYLPSYYGYGTNETEKVPANSVLIFDIDLVSFY